MRLGRGVYAQICPFNLGLRWGTGTAGPQGLFFLSTKECVGGADGGSTHPGDFLPPSPPGRGFPALVL